MIVSLSTEYEISTILYYSKETIGSGDTMKALLREMRQHTYFLLFGLSRPLHQQMQSFHLSSLNDCNIGPLNLRILTLRPKVPRKHPKVMVYRDRTRRPENPPWIFVKEGLDTGVDCCMTLEGLVGLVEYEIGGVY
jgi:hypothetical protein